MQGYQHITNGGFESFSYPNGFKLILAHRPGVGRAQVSMTVRVGSKHEGAGESGMAHLLEHMLFKSTTNIPNIKEYVGNLSKEWNANTSYDRTMYYETVTKDKVVEALSFEFDRLLNASFTEEDLRSEMTVVRNEMDMSESRPDSVLIHAAMKLSYPWHGYSRAVIGARSDVESAPFDVLVRFYRRFYHPSNSFVLVAGDFDRDAVLEQVMRSFAVVAPNDSPARPEWTFDQHVLGSSRQDVYLQVQQSKACFAWRIPPMFTKESVALQFGMSALFSQERGLLYEELVVNEKKLVDLQGINYDLIDGGCYLLFAQGHATQNPHDLEAPLMHRLYACIEQGITDEMLHASKSDERSQYHDILQNFDYLHYAVVDAELFSDWQYLYLRKQWVDEITLEDVNTALRTWVKQQAQQSVFLVNRPLDVPKGYKVTPQKEFPAFESNLVENDPPEASYESLHAKHEVLINDDDTLVTVLNRRNQSGKVEFMFTNVMGTDDSRGAHALMGRYATEVRTAGDGWTRKTLDMYLTEHQACLNWTAQGFSLDVPMEHALNVLQTVVAIYHRPEVTMEEFENTKQTLTARAQSSLSQSLKLAPAELGRIWNNHPTTHWMYSPSYDEVIDDMTHWNYQDMKDSLSWISKRGHVKLTMVGGLSNEELMKWIRAYQEEFETEVIEHAPIKIAPFANHLSADAPLVIQKGNAPNGMVLAKMPLPMSMHHPDAPPLNVAMCIFGGSGGMLTSRLWDSIREKEGLAYQVNGNLNWVATEHRSNIVLVSSCATNTLDKVFNLMKDEWTKFVTDGVTQAELDNAKHYLMQLHESKIHEDSRYVNVLHNQNVSGMNYKAWAMFQHMEQLVTLDQVNQAIQTYFSGLPVQWVMATSE